MRHHPLATCVWDHETGSNSVLMKRAFFSLGLALSVCLPAYAQTLVCGRAPQPPVIDASAQDPCWQEGMVATDFSVLGSGGTERAFRQTTVRAAWDDEALYLHAILLEPDPNSITAKVAERDGQTWMEDALEVFLQPDLTRSDYLHFIVNARGVVYDERSEDPGYDAQARVQAEIGQQAWQVEMAIPWADLSGVPPRPGDEWGFNIGREHRPVEPSEWSTWAPLKPKDKKFAHPDLFGRLKFAEQPASGRASKLSPPEGLAANPDFTDLAEGKPVSWGLAGSSSFGEIVPMSRHYAVRNDGDYGIASQPLDVPVEAGEVFTVFAAIRGGGGATGGIAVVQEMQDGRPDDLYPYWNRELTEDFRLYVGRITVDKGAKRLFSLRLYRSNRKGWVEYAYVQVLPGVYGLQGILDIEECTTSEQRGLGEPWRTPALTAFKPLPEGPLKTLIFIGEFQRDAVELAERLDLDYDLVYCPTYRGSGKVEQVVAADARTILRKLDRHEYDLILLAGRPSDASVITDIIASVRDGTGLVAIEPLGTGKPANSAELQRLLDELPSEALPDDRLSELLGALSPEALAQTSEGTEVLKALSVRELGKGRLVRVAWSEKVPGLVPFLPGVCEYWEYRWAALARASLWAAKRLPTSRIESLACTDDLTIRVRSGQDQPLKLRVQWDCRLGMIEGERLSTGAFTDGLATVSVPLAPRLKLMRGPNLARVILLSEGGPLDLAACVVPGGQPRMEIGDITAPETAEPGETVNVDVKYRAEAEGTLRAELVDAFGRVISRAEVPAEPGEERQVRLELTVREPLSVCHRIVVTACSGRSGDRPLLADGEVVADRQERELFVPAANADHLSEFHLGGGYAAMHIRCPEYLQDALVSFLRAYGVQATTVNEYMIRRGMPAFGGQICGGGMRYSGSDNVREPSFCDPAQVEALATRTVENVGKKRHWGFFGFNMSDEVHLHQRANVEVDASEHCLSAFRDWARREYGTVSALNAEWGTDYAHFDDVVIPLLPDMKETENPARWVDFRLFMERVWANAYAAAHRAVREAYPDVNLSFTNPYKYNSLSGTNFALWLPHEEVLLRYCHRHVMDRTRSWSRAPILSWFGYSRDARQCGHFVWDFALNGGTVPFWWDPLEPWAYSGRNGFTPWYMLGPLWRETGRSRAVTAAAQDLQRGIGKLLQVAEPEPAEAAILHSQPSMHVLYAQAAMPLGKPTNAGYERYAASDEAFAQGLMRQALSYRYVLPDQLTAEELQGVRLLALPSCVALSDQAVDGLRNFVAGGGKLLADVMPATHDEHGRPRPDGSLLADLFETDSAVCLGASADKQAADAIDDAVSRLKVASPIRWRTADGRLPAHTRMYRFRLGAVRYLSVLRDPGEEAAEDGKLRVDMPGEFFAYDSRTGEALGKMRSLDLDVGVGEARFLALLPYRVERIRADASSADAHLTIAAAVEAALTPTDHVFHVEVTPSGSDEPAFHYSRNVLARHGRMQVSIPLALNDPPGEWRIEVQDVATGMSATAQVKVSAVP